MNMFNNLDLIADNIWLGNYFSSKDIEVLKKEGIEKILTIMDDFGPVYKNNDFIHKKI